MLQQWAPVPFPPGIHNGPANRAVEAGIRPAPYGLALVENSLLPGEKPLVFQVLCRNLSDEDLQPRLPIENELDCLFYVHSIPS